MSIEIKEASEEESGKRAREPSVKHLEHLDLQKMAPDDIQSPSQVVDTKRASTNKAEDVVNQPTMFDQEQTRELAC